MAAQTTAQPITPKPWCREHQTDSEGEHCFSGDCRVRSHAPRPRPTSNQVQARGNRVGDTGKVTVAMVSVSTTTTPA
jgi:hypothetical protein